MLKCKVENLEETWYTSRPLGERYLNNMMKTFSQKANLSMIYTNHCVRATTINVLAHAGVSDREIMRITGHKCEKSLNSYHSDSSSAQKRLYSALLEGNTHDISSTHSTPISTHPSTTPVVSSSNTNMQPAVTAVVPPPPSFPLQLNNMNLMQNISNNLPPMYQKQFEVHNSSVQVYNYYMPHPTSQ